VELSVEKPVARWLVAIEAKVVVAEKEKDNNGRKSRGKSGFSPSLAFNFFPLNAWNPPLFIETKREIWPGRISTVGSKWVSWTVKFWQLKATWVGLFGVTVVMSINQKELYWGIVICQVIMVAYILSNLVKRWSIKCTWKVATRAAFSDKKKRTMNSNRHLVIFFFVLFSKQHCFWL